MEKYKDMRIFSFDNGGRFSELVKTERDRRYNSVSTIRLPFKINDYNSFVVYNTEIVNHISSIYQINTQIMSEINNMPKEAYKEYIIMSMIEEIQQSNEYENVESTRQEIEKAYEKRNEGKRIRFSEMVNKYDMLLSKKDIEMSTSSDIRKLYDEFILDEVVNESSKDYPDGDIFRKGTVRVSGKNMGAIHEGLYPESKIIETMDQALRLLNDENIDLLIRVSIFHFMFGYIHPFYNGNGRMSRFISSYMLSEKINLSVCLRISYIIKENRSLYQNMFKIAEDARNMGDITSFVTDFLGLISMACIDVRDEIIEKNEKYQTMKEKLREKLDENEQVIAEKYHKIFYFILERTIFIGRGATIDEIMNSTGVARVTINKMLDKANPFVRKKMEGRTNHWFIKF